MARHLNGLRDRICSMSAQMVLMLHAFVNMQADIDLWLWKGGHMLPQCGPSGAWPVVGEGGESSMDPK